MAKPWDDREKDLVRKHYPTGGVAGCIAAGVDRKPELIRQWARSNRVRYKTKRERELKLIRRHYPTGGTQACIDAGCTLTRGSINHLANEFRIKYLPMSEMSRACGLAPETVYCRVKSGVPLSVALTAPAEQQGVTYNGVKQSIAAHARDAGIRPELAWRRHGDGWPIDKLFAPPRKGEYPRKNPLGIMQKTLLNVLKETGPKTVRQFEEIVNVDAANARRALKRLVEMGEVERDAVYLDARVRHVWRARV